MAPSTTTEGAIDMWLFWTIIGLIFLADFISRKWKPKWQREYERQQRDFDPDAPISWYDPNLKQKQDDA